MATTTPGRGEPGLVVTRADRDEALGARAALRRNAIAGAQKPLQRDAVVAIFGPLNRPGTNRRLATDLTTVWTRRDGVVALVPSIDCGDRTAVIEVTVDQRGPSVLASVEQRLVAAFGSPANVPDGPELMR